MTKRLKNFVAIEYHLQPIDKLYFSDREYFGLYNWQSIMKYNNETCTLGEKPKSQMCIEALEEEIALDNYFAINNIITAYPACVLAHRTTNGFSVFAVYVQREDNLYCMTNYNMIFYVLILSPMEMTHTINLCTPHPTDNGSDLSLTSMSASPNINSIGEAFFK